MNRVHIIPVIILSAGLAGCGGEKPSSAEFVTVDVSANYPEKELILQDFMDVEYIALETTDEFITQGGLEAVGKDILLVRNFVDGDIFIFDRATGKGLRKINRHGQSGEEYTQIEDIILDEDNDEMFVKDYQARKILVYDLYGNFKRSFKFADSCYYVFAFNYDRDNLLCYKTYQPIDTEQSAHVLVSKQDGSITREIPVPFKEIKTPVFLKEDFHVTPSFHLTSPDQGNWVLMNTSSDTIYKYLADGSLSPLIVRTPSIHAMETEVFLFLKATTERYYFMQTLKKEFDLARMKGFPYTNLLYDKQEKALFGYSMYNDDFANKQGVEWSEALDQEIVTHQRLEASQLLEAYEKGNLKEGRLKEIAATLDEESNPVIMLGKHKN
jgi:hypothetical protein